MENPGRRDIMDPCVDELLDLAISHGVQPNDGNIELVVLLRDSQSVQICRYYFVDHSKRLLFWLHKQRTEMLFEGVEGIERLSHISAPSAVDNHQCIDNSCFQSMLSNLSTGKFVIVCRMFSACEILLTTVMDQNMQYLGNIGATSV